MEIHTCTTSILGLIHKVTEEHPILLKYPDKLENYVNDFLVMGNQRKED